MNRGVFRDRSSDEMSITLNIACNENTPRHIEINLCGDEVSRRPEAMRPRYGDRFSFDDEDEVWDDNIPDEDDDCMVDDEAAVEPVEGPDSSCSVVRIAFNYCDDEKDALGQLNQMLSAMRLTDLELLDFNGYLSTQYEYDSEGNLDHTIRSYLPGRGMLVCRSQKDEEAFTYQIDTDILDDMQMDSDEYADHWHATHPEHQIRTLIMQSFKDCSCALIIYHRRAV